MRWIKDPKVENNLRQLEVPFDTATVPVKEVDFEEGISRQARLINGLNQDQVLSMAVAMEQPEAAFPMGILQKPPGKSLYWPWSGNHRYAAYLTAYPAATHVDAYTVTVRDPMLLDLLPRVVNAWESTIGFSKEERVINARYMIEHHSVPTAQAAQMFNVREGWIYQENAVQKTREVLLPDLGKKTSLLSPSTLKKLHALAGNVPVMKATARLIVEYGLVGSEAYLLINEVRVQTSENSQRSELARWEKMLEGRRQPQPKTSSTPSRNGTGTGRPGTGTVKEKAIPRRVRTEFIRLMTQLQNMVQKYRTVTQLQLTDPADLLIVDRAYRDVKSVMEGIVAKPK